MMSTTFYTPEDLLRLPDSKNYELVDGKLAERAAGCEASWVGANRLARLGQFSEGQHLGWVVNSGCGYQCFPRQAFAGSTARRVVRQVRPLPEGVLPRGWAKIPPDLVVEVVSPNDTVYDLEERLEDFRSVQVPLIWVINPARHGHGLPPRRLGQLLEGDGRTRGRGRRSRVSMPPAGDSAAASPARGRGTEPDRAPIALPRFRA